MTVIVNHRTPLVVPPAVRKQAGFKSGDKLEFRVTGHVVTIVPKASPSDDEYTPAQRRAIDRGIAGSEKQYAAGKSYGRLATPTSTRVQRSGAQPDLRTITTVPTSCA